MTIRNTVMHMASGLYCSGYIAWVVYNTLYSKNDQADIVTTSSVIASTYRKRLVI